VLNLLKISFSTNNIFISPINYERNEIIKNSKSTERPLSKGASSREVAKSALHQQGLNFGSDWTIFNNKVITFHDLTDNSLPLSKIIDSSNIENSEPFKFYSK
jgi:hypothetical protein